MFKKFGFSLAEILVTLGIIGIVAIMTVPSLTSSVETARFKSQYRKTLSVLNQAGTTAKAVYELDFASVSTRCSSDPAYEKLPNYKTFCGLFNSTLTGSRYTGIAFNHKDNTGALYNIDYVFLSGGSFNLSNVITYTLQDGSMIAFKKNINVGKCTVGYGKTVYQLIAEKECIGLIDVNGDTLPNQEVMCSTDGVTALRTKNNEGCDVDARHITDIYPIVFHDGIVEPATNAANSVFTGINK